MDENILTVHITSEYFFDIPLSLENVEKATDLLEYFIMRPDCAKREMPEIRKRYDPKLASSWKEAASLGKVIQVLHVRRWLGEFFFPLSKVRYFYYVIYQFIEKSLSTSRHSPSLYSQRLSQTSFALSKPKSSKSLHPPKAPPMFNP